MEKTDVLVVGGGPGGLACATRLAQNGVRVVLVERKERLGDKVCAGGITWNGLLRSIPDSLIERQFTDQFVATARQRVLVTAPHPIAATINRSRFGGWMRERAEAAGVVVLAGTRLAALEPGLAVLESSPGQRRRIAFGHLAGADGANSLVRRFLGLPTTAMGLGVHGMFPIEHPHMEWHLDARLFGIGYGWVFPHANSCSIGAYSVSPPISAQRLKDALLCWAGRQGWLLEPTRLRAGLVNFDYRGFRFPGGWLIGEAAGLTSGLTGEGIYPALVSGQAVANCILGNLLPDQAMPMLLRKHRQHRRLAELAGCHQRLCGLMMEAMALALRLRLLDFRRMEMAAPAAEDDDSFWCASR